MTGVGLVCGCGIGTDEVWRNLLAGKSGIALDHPIRRLRFRLPDRRRSEGFRSAQLDREKRTEEDGAVHPAGAGRDRFRHAAWRSSKSRRSIADATGVYIGSGIGGFDVIEREHSKYLKGGPGKISPFFIPAAIINLASGNISIRYGAKGPNSATATACSASAHAVGDAFKMIQRGDAEVMIAGGSEAAITPMGIGGFAAMSALSTRNDEPERASRPFRRRPRRLRGRRRLGHIDPRIARICPAPRREYHRRDRRLRNVRRRVSHHAARRGRRRRLSRVARGHQGRQDHAG